MPLNCRLLLHLVLLIMDQRNFLSVLGDGLEGDAATIDSLSDIGDHLDASTGKLSVIHLNIRSLKKHFDELLLLVGNNTLLFDVLVLTESWRLDCIDNYRIPGYVGVYNESQCNQNDGVVVYIRDTLVFSSEIKEYCGNCKILVINIYLGDFKLNLSCLYRSPSGNINQFLDTLRQHLEYTGRNYHNDWINTVVGDMNLDILNKLAQTSNDYLNLMAQYGYISFINKPTRVTCHSSTCIDHIFIKRPQGFNHKIQAFILNNDVTDHYTVILTIDSTAQKNKHEKLGI